MQSFHYHQPIVLGLSMLSAIVKAFSTGYRFILKLIQQRREATHPEISATLIAHREAQDRYVQLILINLDQQQNFYGRAELHFNDRGEMIPNSHPPRTPTPFERFNALLHRHPSLVFVLLAISNFISLIIGRQILISLGVIAQDSHTNVAASSLANVLEIGLLGFIITTIKEVFRTSERFQQEKAELQSLIQAQKNPAIVAKKADFTFEHSPAYTPQETEQFVGLKLQRGDPERYTPSQSNAVRKRRALL